MKNTLCLLALIFTFQLAAIEQIELDQITYGWLKKNDPNDSGEYLPYYLEMFAQFKEKNILQLGVGYLSKYFLDHCKKVISVEFITAGYGPGRMKDCMTLYKKYSNWIPIAYFSAYQGDTNWTFFKYFGSDNLYKANNYQVTMFMSYSSVDKAFLNEIGSFLGNLIKLNKFEFVHVDPSMYIRGDIIQILFGKVPIIVAGDANTRIQGGHDIYGYNAVVTPDDYEELRLRNRTVIWISKNEKYAELIENLKDM